MKTCPRCNILKTYNEFHLSRTRPDGHQSICKTCISKRDKKDRLERGLKLPAHPHMAIDPETGRFMSIIPLIERFWSYVDSSAGPDACWPWIGALDDKNGYGLITIRRTEDLPPGLPSHSQSTTYGAHRVAYAILIGPIPDGLDILHTCDFMPCVNAYEHLYPGTPQQNMDDRQERDRDAHGERNGNVHLTESMAREIFSIKGQYSSLAVEKWFPVSSSTILRIWNKQLWKHIHDQYS